MATTANVLPCTGLQRICIFIWVRFRYNAFASIRRRARRRSPMS